MLTDWIPRNRGDHAGGHATDRFKAAVKELMPRVVRRERVPFVPFLPR